ncbi:RPAP1-C multi-domain protein [Pyrenophora tritici-repentis]|uniref:RPAP1-C multi-domain protein n=1 Tax=Pyrenophora tritici-repentis TaxID=45151 RepID=A0A2W1EBW6_9PLEO|nr:RPAP1-C multi-domain protein [Pyrenophora tritici-repentis]KAI0582567.1 RPAP1-C multi-domain protein [Pyrenophora tritici-repentis]KAI0587811.1 RPAP1-C multi-domain protein [Pyrenophora tritici-repentis]KAI0609252.1 RPAP1-C multi-domain protein [Pyrenophora tritici-repentis]KAI0624323.1 RPAP1-C multi-domain protein [Pyrenophora tritici-repentis]
MEFQRGERVNLNFDTGAVEKLDHEEQQHASPMPVFPSFVGDIQERDSSLANPPVAPSPKPNVNGFPAHKKRVPKVSAFKQQRAAKEQQAAAAAAAPPKAPPKAQDAPQPQTKPRSAFGVDRDEERRAIDEENRRTLAAMSDAEIEQERQDLLSSLNPVLLQKLLLRSNIDDGSNERDWDSVPPEPVPAAEVPPPVTDQAELEPQTKAPIVPSIPTNHPEAEATTTSPSVPDEQPTDSIHFPQPPQPPSLDPGDPAFLKTLHEKYFPLLPYDPSTLSWMEPIDPSDTKSPYHPSQTALNPAELRFDFSGNLLPPSVARSIPTDRGLHHHAEAPEAAGYTIPELAVTARSKVASQRCIAYQTLGRILYRLGKGQYGAESPKKNTDGPVRIAKNPDVQDDDEEGEWVEDDVGAAISEGLWQCVKEGRVIETLTEEANKERGHLTARTYAQEALWNWQRGGGRKTNAV